MASHNEVNSGQFFPTMTLLAQKQKNIKKGTFYVQIYSGIC